MRAIVFSDLHIHDTMTNLPNHLEDCMEILDIVFQTAYEDNLDGIIFCGDLFHQPKNIPLLSLHTTIKKFSNLFKDYPTIKFYCISGNHDQATQNIRGKESLNVLQVFDEVFDNFILIDNETGSIAGKIVHGVPFYTYPEHLEEVLKELDPNKIDILLLHNTPSEIFNTHIPTQVDTDVLSKFKQVFIGHIHKPQLLRDNVLVLGSPKYLDRGDAGDEKFIYLYDSEAEEPIQLFPTPFDKLDIKERKVKDNISERVETTHYDMQTQDKHSLLAAYCKDMQLDEETTKIGLGRI